jgi:hypothetical protein
MCDKTHRIMICVRGKEIFPLCMSRRHNGEWYIAPIILNLSNRWGEVVSFTPRPIYAFRNSPWYHLDGRLDVTKNRSRYFGGKKIILSLSRTEPHLLGYWVVIIVSNHSETDPPDNDTSRMETFILPCSVSSRRLTRSCVLKSFHVINVIWFEYFGF